MILGVGSGVSVAAAVGMSVGTLWSGVGVGAIGGRVCGIGGSVIDGGRVPGFLGPSGFPDTSKTTRSGSPGSISGGTLPVKRLF